MATKKAKKAPKAAPVNLTPEEKKVLKSLFTFLADLADVLAGPDHSPKAEASAEKRAEFRKAIEAL